MKAGIVIFCFGYVNEAWLLVWFAVGIAVIAYRLSVEKRYAHQDALNSLQQQEEFVTRLSRCTPFTGPSGASRRCFTSMACRPRINMPAG
ncbi:MAG: hypothetical protein EON54_01060 [Alcaligenaceae bacterium]|nr:MAG: hypothetical protein EON54_01060 [Alcaligenaceae bacterium]